MSDPSDNRRLTDFSGLGFRLMVKAPRMENQNEPLSLVLFSGTDDKLSAATVLAAGAAAMGRPVHLFL